MIDRSQPTAIQRRVLDFVREYLTTHRRAPSLREISSSFNWSSPASARDHLRALVRKGYLQRGAGLHRVVALPPTNVGGSE